MSKEIYKWIAGGAVGLVATISLAYAASISARADAIETKADMALQKNSVTEAHYSDIDRRLERIENKVDNLQR